MFKAIRKLAFLSIMVIIFFLILLGIAGRKGYLVNKDLKKLSFDNQEKIALLEVQEKALKSYEASLKDTAQLDDIALRLGYNKTGEEVYFFSKKDQTSINEDGKVFSEDEKDVSFQGISAPLLFLISILLVFLPYLLIILLKFILYRENYVPRREKDRGYDDYHI